MSIEDIRSSASNGKLIVVLGAGVSIGLMPRNTEPLSWLNLVRSGLNFGHARGLLKEEQRLRNEEALLSSDIDDLLGAAEFVSRKLGAPDGSDYAKWMRDTFSPLRPESGGMLNALKALDAQKVQVATLNYDTLYEAATGAASIDVANVQEALEWARNDRGGILHLHGVWTNPKNCVFGIRDYHSAVGDETRSLLQRTLGTFNRLLFVGCGDTFSDPNFRALIDWLKRHVGAGTPQHYALVKENEYASRLIDPSWRGFVEPVSYGDDHADLPGFLLNCFPTRRSPSAPESKERDAAARDTLAITAYKNFLIRDCGEMAIEGIRADMDTAQSKFDLEKLFVPLQLLKSPPNLPSSEAGREKLQRWLKENSSPTDFNVAFAENHRIALLALPGGGKTLLLKRLAVAYAMPGRKDNSTDNLPDLDLLPLMIRCREWKEHIRKPITTLLQNFPEITGDRQLSGLAEALEKPLKSGKILLLVDGLDEIHNDGDRTEFVDNLEKFLESYPKIRVVLTSREAGFDLVAPKINRFCEKFKIAPLSGDAIDLLCKYWHQLMVGEKIEAIDEARSVSAAIQRNASLRKLAENPLLLTMLLVVKHGAGRLPPDRGSLYERAVEVLLDTWNIKGHDALNQKEAVPQLACLAFELMRRGEQTATEAEILAILETARTQLPMIGRYAKDTPSEFLKRVELRSSLLVEGGHKIFNGRAVPFYQFRHLTFQEYMAAVAAVNNYVIDPPKEIGVHNVLADYLLSDKWKEVIPMAAMLAGMHAAPLLRSLLFEAQSELEAFDNNAEFDRDEMLPEWRLPPATSRLVQSLIEEATFPNDVVEAAAFYIVRLARGCRTNDQWSTLAKGPYGNDLREAALNLFMEAPFKRSYLARNTVAIFEAASNSTEYWQSNEAADDLLDDLKQVDDRAIARTILRASGSFWNQRQTSTLATRSDVYEQVETFLFDERPAVVVAATWFWGFWRHLQNDLKLKPPVPSPQVVARLIHVYFQYHDSEAVMVRHAFGQLEGISRGCVEYPLTDDQRVLINGYLADDQTLLWSGTAVLRIAYSIKDAFADIDLREFIEPRLDKLKGYGVDDILLHFGYDLGVKRRRRRS